MRRFYSAMLTAWFGGGLGFVAVAGCGDGDAAVPGLDGAIADMASVDGSVDASLECSPNPPPGPSTSCSVGFPGLPLVDLGPSGSSMDLVVSADFNGDGVLDLATASYGGQLSVALNNGRGRFMAAAQYPTAANTMTLAAADLDGNGAMDLIVTGANSHEVFVHLGACDGTFAAAATYPASTPPQSQTWWLYELAIADFTMDGRPDIAVVPHQRDSVSLLVNRGDGSFSAPISITTGRAYDIAAGDVDGDGHPDLVVANGIDNTVSVLLGSGAAAFAAPVTYPVATSASSLELGDLDGDGKLDIAVAIQGDSIATLANNGDGTFATPVSVSMGPFPGSLELADLDGDNDLDIVALTQGGDDTYVSVALNMGAGTFAAPSPYFIGPGGSVYDASLTLADLNGDARPDIVAWAAILLNVGNGTFETQRVYPTHQVWAIAVADLNADGKADVVAGSETIPGGSLGVLLNDGSGALGAPTVYDTASTVRGVAIGDLDQDGKPDLVAAALSNVTVRFHDGDVVFTESTTLAAGGYPRDVILRDFNGDGLLDIATANEAYSGMYAVTVWLNAGNRVFATRTDYALNLSASSLASGDLDGDAKPDLVISSLNGAAQVLLNNGSGAFSAPTPIASNAFWVALGDLDGDTKLDVVATTYTTTNVLRGNGDGTFGMLTSYDIPGGYTVALGQLDGDAMLDMVVTTAADRIHVLLNDGTGGFGGRRSFATGRTVTAAAIVDLDDNGMRDIVVANNLGRSVGVLPAGACLPD